LGQKDKAKDASAKSDVRNAVTQLESCLVDDTFANCTATGKIVEGVSSDTDGTTGTATPSSSSYTLQVTSKSGSVFRISKSGAPGQYTRSCVAASGSDGGCVNGTW
jgi:type IV pilus assembly protein PilA